MPRNTAPDSELFIRIDIPSDLNVQGTTFCCLSNSKQAKHQVERSGSEGHIESHVWLFPHHLHEDMSEEKEGEIVEGDLVSMVRTKKNTVFYLDE